MAPGISELLVDEDFARDVDRGVAFLSERWNPSAWE
jgi:hypothetical protein